MRVPKGWIPIIATEILKTLRDQELADISTSEESARDALVDSITNELMTEDRLNHEVREILRKYEAQIDQGGADYRRLFDLTKQKLVRERNLIL